ncbi:MAG: hypothetical protein P4M08_09320 [Oligoflexia bacterium]|nr:hypothetical protein [Oligoflexia bacterium]
MKEYAPYFNHQMARFGSLTIQQMLTLGQTRFRRSTLYYHIKNLKREHYVVRISHQQEAKIGYSATSKLYEMVYGREHHRHTGPRSKELDHSIQVANVMLERAQD